MSSFYGAWLWGYAPFVVGRVTGSPPLLTPAKEIWTGQHSLRADLTLLSVLYLEHIGLQARLLSTFLSECEFRV